LCAENGVAQRVLSKVLAEIRPTPRDEQALKGFSERIIELLGKAFPKSEVDQISVEGSLAKRTWLRGREEVDVFAQFLPSVPKERMAKLTVGVASEVISSLGGVVKLRYAEHPYVEGIINGVRVNIVPCYRVEPGGWLTAVDRTPYHTRYVRSELSEEAADQVRLLKAFLHASGLYGAEIRVGGFSGYVSELLIILHDSFLKLIHEAANWRPPVVIDASKSVLDEKQREKFPSAPMILVDPVDVDRNAAAAVSLQKLSEFIILSKLFEARPSEAFFRAPPDAKMPQEPGMRSIVGILFGLRKARPPDVLWGEILSTGSGYETALRRHGFGVWRWEAWSDESKVMLLYELESLSLPQFYLHQGPEVHRPQALSFIHKHVGSRDTAAGPYVRGERLYAVKKRHVRTAADALSQATARGEVAVAADLKDELATAEILQDLETILQRVGEDREMHRFIVNFIGGLPPYITHLSE